MDERKKPMGNGNSQAFLDMTRERWSVRKFKEERVSAEHMERILEAGRTVPSACGSKPQRVLVLQSDDALARMRSVTYGAFNAPRSFKDEEVVARRISAAKRAASPKPTWWLVLKSERTRST